MFSYEYSERDIVSDVSRDEELKVPYTTTCFYCEHYFLGFYYVAFYYVVYETIVDFSALILSKKLIIHSTVGLLALTIDWRNKHIRMSSSVKIALT